MKANLRPLALPLIFLVALNIIPSLTLRPLWFVVFALTLLSYRLWLEWNQHPMPPRWTQWIVQGSAGVAVWQHYHSLFGDEAAGTWLTLLTILKLFELRTHRDYFVTALLCFLVLMSVLLLNQSLLLSFFLLADVLLIVGFLFALEDEKWQWSQWRLHLRKPLMLFAKVLPLLVLIFILFPRFSTGFGTGKDSGGKTGMTDKLRPGSISSLTPSDELVFRATFLRAEVPPRQSLYWRGAVLDRANGLNWDRSSDGDLRRPRLPLQTQDEIEIYMEPGSDKFLFTLGNTSAVHFPNDSVARRMGYRDGGIYELGQPLQTRERYFLESSAVEVEDTKDMHKYLQLEDQPSPQLNEFLKPYRDLPTSEVVRELQDNFRKKGYGYTLQPPKVSSVEEFLFNTKAGFCEHFAGTMATLLRHLKIPSRVVVGFQGGSPSFLESYITVRAHDAHAWVEYYDAADRRWRRTDPTASVDPTRFIPDAQGYSGREWVPGWVPNRWSTAYLKARALVDELEAGWVGFLLHFDLAKQRELLAKLGMEAVLFRALPVFLILAVALVLAVLYFIEAQGREQLSTEDLLYRKFLRALKPFKLVKNHNEGPLTLMRRIEEFNAELAARSHPILAALTEARFGSKNLSRAAAAEIARQIRSLTKPLSR